MKVLFLSHQADFVYGGEICTLAFMKELKKQGVEVHFASPKGDYLERARSIAIVHEIPSMQFSRKVHLLPRLLPALVKTHRVLRKIVREQEIEIVHATSLKAMVYAWRLKRHLPVVWHHHDILPLRFRNELWIRTLARAASLIVTPSEATGSALIESGVEREKVYVLYNGFTISEWKARSEGPSEKIKIALVGEISKRKGFDMLPKIISELKKNASSFEFLIAGEALSDVNYAADLKAELAPAIKARMVNFLGRVEDMKSFYQNIDILLVPSKQDPLPTVIVEAGLSGIPVIASPVGGIPEMIENGKNGFLADSATDYVAAILRLFNSTTWKELSKNSRTMAEKKFDIEILSSQLLEQYRYIVK